MGLCIFITINRTINIILGKLGDYMEQKKIAVVDDNEDICRMVKQYLEFNNYYVETYEEGNKALENITKALEINGNDERLKNNLEIIKKMK